MKRSVFYGTIAAFNLTAFITLVYEHAPYWLIASMGLLGEMGCLMWSLEARGNFGEPEDK